MTQFITRAYNSFSFDYRKSTIKKHSKEIRLAHETDYYKNLPAHLSVYFPRLISSGFNKKLKEYFLELELYPYENLGRLMVDGKLTGRQWEAVARQLGYILSEFAKTTKFGSFLPDQRAMYIEKTETEYARLKQGFKVFGDLSAQTILKINGKQYENFELVWPKIKKKYLGKLLQPQKKLSVIHGDFCFSNILAGFLKDGRVILRFVDPRGTFGSQAVYGDSYYDLAKLMHSTDIGYEYLIYDRFRIGRTGKNSFSLVFSDSAKKAAANKIFFKDLYSKYDLTRIRLIEATIYIGMCARHYDSPKRQLAMYLSGVKLLNEILWN